MQRMDNHNISSAAVQKISARRRSSTRGSQGTFQTIFGHADFIFGGSHLVLLSWLPYLSKYAALLLVPDTRIFSIRMQGSAAAVVRHIVFILFLSSSKVSYLIIEARCDDLVASLLGHVPQQPPRAVLRDTRGDTPAKFQQSANPY